VAAAQVLVVIFVLLGCVALAVDVGFIYDARGAMQSAVDASSLAGASALQTGHGPARTRAVEYATKNSIAKQALQSNEMTVTIGNWDGLLGQFFPAAESDPITPNAIRVRGERDGVPLFFASVFGKSTTNLDRFATAVQGGAHCLGIWGLEGVSAQGDIVTDSYDKRTGNYGGSNVRPNGDLCSCSDLTVGGDTSIHGDAIYGENDELIIHGSSYEVWGVTGSQDCNFNPPEFDLTAECLANDNALIPPTDDGSSPWQGQGRMFLTDNDVLTLPPGKFCVDSIRIVSMARLEVTGPTQIYISGNADFGGQGIINTTADPRNLVIYGTGATMSYSGGSTFYGGIVAPETNIIFVGDSTNYGVMVGKTLDFRGSTIVHVEESLIKDLYGLEAIAPALVE
jgi:hypothetical protein